MKNLPYYQKVILYALGLFLSILLFHQGFQWREFSNRAYDQWLKIETKLNTQIDLIERSCALIETRTPKEQEQKQILLEKLKLSKAIKKRSPRIKIQNEIQTLFSYLNYFNNFDQKQFPNPELAQLAVQIDELQNQLRIETSRYNELELRKQAYQEKFPLLIFTPFFSRAELFLMNEN